MGCGHGDDATTAATGLQADCDATCTHESCITASRRAAGAPALLLAVLDPPRTRLRGRYAVCPARVLACVLYVWRAARACIDRPSRHVSHLDALVTPERHARAQRAVRESTQREHAHLGRSNEDGDLKDRLALPVLQRSTRLRDSLRLAVTSRRGAGTRGTSTIPRGCPAGMPSRRDTSYVMTEKNES